MSFALPVFAIAPHTVFFLVARGGSEKAKSVFIRTYLNYPEVTLGEIARQMIKPWTNEPQKHVHVTSTPTVTITDLPIAVELTYVGHGKMTIDVHKKEIVLSCIFYPTDKTRDGSKILQNVHEIMKGEESLKDFTIRIGK